MTAFNDRLLEPLDGIDELILGVEKPARYLGRELNAVVKDARTARVRFGLAFPDLYEVGMSNVGMRTLYHALNERPDALCERFFMPAPDLEAAMRARGLPLFSLESRLAARAFDILGFSMQFELCYTTVLAMLDLAEIPLRAADRRRDDPLVLGGGPCAYNPEPVADFFDAIVVGEGEEVVHEIGDVVADWKPGRESRADLLWRLSEIDGVYVPSLFRVHYNPDRTIRAYEPLKPGYARVERRIIPDLDAVPMPEKPLLPFMQTIHDRLPIEIQRGCTRGCRFCQVGMITRPVRQRSPASVRKLAAAGLAATGYDEVGFLSLSAGDYECINGLLEDFFDRFAPERVAISLPSLRTETMNEHLAEQIRRVRKSGFTIAPEAATERMRRVINKGNKEENLLGAVESVFRSGWDLVKMYFMIGLPTETDDDVRAIVGLSARMLDLARRHAANPRINVAVSTFIPKPFTPFQWEPMIPLAETRRRHAVLREELKKLPRKYNPLSVKTHDAEQSSVEGALALGDRRLGTAVYEAFRRGQRLDGWTEHFHLDRWNEALAEMERQHGVDTAWFAHRGRGEREVLPWDHIDSGVSRRYLAAARKKAHEEAEVPDCVIARCSACGACDYFTVDNRVYRAADMPVVVKSDGVELPVVSAEPLAVPHIALEAEAVPSENSGPQRSGPQKSGPQQRDEPARQAPPKRTVVRVQYAKEGRVRALGHLETKTVLERALRRSALPIAWTQGFSPRPKISLSPALGTGLESRAEFIDLVLDGEVEAQTVADALGPRLPPGYRLVGAEADPAGEVNDPVVATYVAEVDAPRARVEEAIARAAALAEWTYVRRKEGREKSIDLRRCVKGLAAADGALRMELLQSQEGGVRPAEVVQALLGTAARRIIKESVRPA